MPKKKSSWKATEREFHVRVGILVRRAREARNLSATEFAARVGSTQPAISNIEAARQRATLRQLVLFAEVLGVRVTELLPSQRYEAPSP